MFLDSLVCFPDSLAQPPYLTPLPRGLARPLPLPPLGAPRPLLVGIDPLMKDALDFEEVAGVLGTAVFLGVALNDAGVLSM